MNEVMEDLKNMSIESIVTSYLSGHRFEVSFYDDRMRKMYSASFIYTGSHDDCIKRALEMYKICFVAWKE